jgi:hypothetical protein
MLDGAGAQSIMYSSNCNSVELIGDVDLEFARLNRVSLHDLALLDVANYNQPSLQIPKGCVVRMIDLAPSTESNLHRALTLGIVTVCEGEVELSLSEDRTGNRVLRPGDVCIKRGAMHRWRNNPRRSRLACSLLCWMLKLFLLIIKRWSSIWVIL